MTEPSVARSLAGLRVLDLSRVLAGPWCAQILGDLGADVIKVEQPGVGDDTRRWGPPFIEDGSGDSAYYVCANRNKRALAVDFSQPEGAAVVRMLAGKADVVVENFRVGGLKKYGLDYETLAGQNAGLVYCSITGFGQTGPYRDRGGYDFLIQGMSGLMSITGAPEEEAGSRPMKVGVAVSDLGTALYATIAILAALRHREQTGNGQHIDCALFDTQISLLANQASNWLNGRRLPVRMGNQHPNIVPYQDFATADGIVLVALGNDRQFRSLCKLLGRSDLAEDPRFASNADRVAGRQELIEALSRTIATWRSRDLLAAMDAHQLPGGPVNTVADALADPHTEARGVVHAMCRDDGTSLGVLGFPARLSRTPADYRLAPPRAGQDTREVLRSWLGMDDAEFTRLQSSGLFGEGAG